MQTPKYLPIIHSFYALRKEMATKRKKLLLQNSGLDYKYRAEVTSAYILLHSAPKWKQPAEGQIFSTANEVGCSTTQLFHKSNMELKHITSHDKRLSMKATVVRYDVPCRNLPTFQRRLLPPPSERCYTMQHPRSQSSVSTRSAQIQVYLM
jgi:hypothetical protein